MQIICFEDDLVDQLRPITQARPAYAITCASLRLVDWLQTLGGTVTAEVRPFLRLIQKLDFQIDEPAPTEDDEGILLVNARVVPSTKSAKVLKELAGESRSSVVTDTVDGSVLAARITAADMKFAASQPDASPQKLQSASAKPAPAKLGESQPTTAAAGSYVEALWKVQSPVLAKSECSLDAFRWPHDVVQCHMSEMSASIEWRLANGNYTQTEDGVFVAEGVCIGNYPVIDTSEGAILLESDVKVGPFCYLSGPVYAGAGTRVIEHAALKDGVSLGHTVKIGGEVEASVIEPYTNKQHHGFLGHSYLGSWINLGAGTCNSDLKNTYGKINVEYNDKKVATGMQFMGCVMGDYSKTAINTSIFTGKVIGVCSMMYGFVTTNVPSFVNYARLFGQTAPLPPDVMINTQQRMFSRRKVQQRECDKQLIIDMYEQSKAEREDVDQYGL